MGELSLLRRKCVYRSILPYRTPLSIPREGKGEDYLTYSPTRKRIESQIKEMQERSEQTKIEVSWFHQCPLLCIVLASSKLNPIPLLPLASTLLFLDCGGTSEMECASNTLCNLLKYPKLGQVYNLQNQIQAGGQ